MPKPLGSRLLNVLEPLLLISVLVALACCALFRVRQTGLLSALIVLMALAFFMLRFEGLQVKPRDIMPIVVMVAIAVALRIFLTPFPNFQPVSAIVIITGIGFGRRSGFMTGALAALVSNLFMGQGPWTPWQMYVWGMMGYAAGALATTSWFRQRWQVCIFGGIAAEFYGLVLDTYSVFAFFNASTLPTILAVYSGGFAFNVVHILSTAAFLWLTYRPWMKQLDRIKQKYGIGSEGISRAPNEMVR
ncbi:MAG: ECF transporter S component [Actinomycetia bacterium]|nr:ECF transporter S component [Actinomycetes bacterium]